MAPKVFGGGGEKCARCLKTVYAAEKIKAVSQVFIRFVFVIDTINRCNVFFQIWIYVLIYRIGIRVASSAKPVTPSWPWTTTRTTRRTSTAKVASVTVCSHMPRTERSWRMKWNIKIAKVFGVLQHTTTIFWFLLYTLLKHIYAYIQQSYLFIDGRLDPLFLI